MDSPFRTIVQPLDTLRLLIPVSKPFLPVASSLACHFIESHLLPFGHFGVKPGFEVIGLEIRELQEQVGQVSLEINNDARDTVKSSLFQ